MPAFSLDRGKTKFTSPYKLSNKVIDWKPRWFYVENQWESVPSITPGPPIQWPEWNKKPADESQIPELLALIANLRQKNVTGEAVMFNWMKRRIQPLQAREMLSFQYQGTTDSSRYLEEEISDEEVFSRVQRLLRDVKKIPIVPDMFSAANPPKQVL